MNRKIFLVLLTIIALLPSCELAFDKIETGSDNIESVFSDKKKAQEAFYALYDAMRFTESLQVFNDGSTTLYMDAATDNGMVTLYQYNLKTFNFSQLQIGASPFYKHNPWLDWYSAIRMANIFLTNIDSSPLSHEEKEQMKIEARFLRAVYYCELFKCFGALVIVGDSPTESLSYDGYERTDISTTVDYIKSELEAVIPLLKKEQEWGESEYGRATQGMAMAYKARLLIYYASPLNTEGCSSSEIHDRWVAAAAACKELIDTDWYSLHPDYEEFFYTRKTKEHIVTDFCSRGTMAWNVLPQPYHKDGVLPAMRPTFNFIDGCLMSDGKKPILGYDGIVPVIDPKSHYDDEHPFEGRDPRLLKSVLKHGDKIFYNGKWNEIDMLNQTEFTPTTYNGFYVRKYIDVDHDFWNNGGIEQNYPIIRYADILLYYAEVENQANGPSKAVIDNINLVRERAGADLLDEHNDPYGRPWTMESLNSHIMDERRMEFFCEDQRFWDARRWLKAKEWFNGPILGGRINGGKYERYVMETRLFLDKMYRLPIPRKDVMGSNGKIYQNPNW